MAVHIPHPSLSAVVDYHRGIAELTEREAERLRVSLTTSTLIPSKTVLASPDKAAEMPHIILSGWLMEAILLSNAEFQVIDFHLPGDLLYCPPIRRKEPFTTYTALTDVTLSTGDLVFDQATWAKLEFAAEHEKQRRQFSKIIWLGERAEERLSCLLLDLFERLARVGLIKDKTFDCHATQEVLGNAIGVSAVHCNRVLQKLRSTRMIQFDSKQVAILDASNIRARSRSLELLGASANNCLFA